MTFHGSLRRANNTTFPSPSRVLAWIEEVALENSFKTMPRRITAYKWDSVVVCAPVWEEEGTGCENEFNDFVPLSKLVPLSKRLAKRDKCTKLREIEMWLVLPPPLWIWRLKILWKFVVERNSFEIEKFDFVRAFSSLKLRNVFKQENNDRKPFSARMKLYHCETARIVFQKETVYRRPCYDGVSRVLSERGRRRRRLRRRFTVSPVEIVSQRARSQVWPGRRYH